LRCRQRRQPRFFKAKDFVVKKYVTSQNIAALARIAVLCALACLDIGFSPALVATLMRGVNAGVTLSAMRLMIAPLVAGGEWMLPFGGGATRLVGSNHFVGISAAGQPHDHHQ
jgi:hypothetical protein